MKPQTNEFRESHLEINSSQHDLNHEEVLKKRRLNLNQILKAYFVEKDHKR